MIFLKGYNLNETVIAICGEGLSGRTTLMMTLGKCLEETRLAKIEYEKPKVPGIWLGYTMRIQSDGCSLKFVWFRGTSRDARSAREWVLSHGDVVIFIFSDFQIDQAKTYQAHKDVAAAIKKLPPMVQWLHVINVRENFPHREPNPYPPKLSDSIIEINARTGRGLDRLWFEILRLAGCSGSEQSTILESTAEKLFLKSKNA